MFLTGGGSGCCKTCRATSPIRVLAESFHETGDVDLVLRVFRRKLEFSFFLFRKKGTRFVFGKNEKIERKDTKECKNVRVIIRIGRCLNSNES